LEQKKEENLVKKTCKELGITQKELANFFGVSQNTITTWRKGNLNKVQQTALNGLIFEHKYNNTKKILSTIVNQI
jgi:predicted transcriptional regulator